MEGNNWILSCAVLAILVLGGSSVIFQGSIEADGYIEELVLPYDLQGTVWGVDGMYMVYTVEINSETRVILRNIHNGSERKIVDFESFQPDVSGDHVVFLGYHNDLHDVYLYTISSDIWIKITNDPIVEWGPKIDHGHVVFYKDTPQRDNQIFHYHISTGIRELSTSSASDKNPNVQGTMVVWESLKPGYSIIMGYDLVSNIEFEVVNESFRPGVNPDIYADRVVFMAIDFGIRGIYLFNLTTRNQMWISDHGLESDYPRIDRYNVVFMSMHGVSFNGDVWLYDIQNGALRQLTDIDTEDQIPVIWGEHVFFTRSRHSMQIYHILLDYDNDGMPDQKDMFPYNPTEIFDTDGDGLGDNIDRDADNDGVHDEMDAFPFEPLEWADFDGDGLGDNIDEDDDNDGIPDIDDMMPYSDINPIMDLIHMMMMRIEEMQENLTNRLEQLEANMAGLMEENNAGIMEGIEVALADLNDTLSRINLSGDLEAMRINFSEILAQEPDWYDAPDSFFDIFTQLVVDLGNDLTARLEDLSLGLNHTRGDISDLNDQVEALEEIEGIVADLEEVGRNVESQSDNLETSDSNLKTYFIVLIIVLAVYTVIMILFFLSVSRKKKDENFEEY